MTSLLDRNKPVLLSLLLANIRGLRSNFSELTLVAATQKPTILALTETWLEEDAQDNCILATYCSAKIAARDVAEAYVLMSTQVLV